MLASKVNNTDLRTMVSSEFGTVNFVCYSPEQAGFNPRFFSPENLTNPDFSPIFTNRMSKVTLKNTPISELVDQNYVHAYVLFYFGIRFYEYSALTLEQVCEQHGLKVEQVVREMESPTYLREAELP